jgi:hypothetical protein
MMMMMLAAHQDQGRWVQQVCSGLSVARVKPHATFHWPPWIYLLPRQPGQRGGTAYLSQDSVSVEEGLLQDASRQLRFWRDGRPGRASNSFPLLSGHRKKPIDALRWRPR